MATHNIYIHNMSGKDQPFDIHGDFAQGGSQRITVGAGQTYTIPANDGQSGAVLAVHDGVECEQAEITKAGWGGNDTVDLSNIVGAGGNMTVCQIGGSPDVKGDPTFMQDCNTAWQALSADQKAAIQPFVFLDGNGNVERIGAPKASQALESFVRTFAEGQTYIGIGSWDGNAGDAGDNAQSKAGVGSTDILITYNDGNACPNPPGQSKIAHRAHMLLRTLPKRITAPIQQKDAPPPQPSGPGIILSNKSSVNCSYSFYNNLSNGNGTAVPNFSTPDQTVVVCNGSSIFVPLDPSFKGRVQRGTSLPATWAEFQIKADDGAAWGDISLEMGCDGAAQIGATDGQGVTTGFSNDIVSGAPAAALVNNGVGQKVIDTTMGWWGGQPNQAAVDYENSVVGQQNAYILGGTGTIVAKSGNNCLAVTFY